MDPESRRQILVSTEVNVSIDLTATSVNASLVTKGRIAINYWIPATQLGSSQTSASRIAQNKLLKNVNRNCKTESLWLSVFVNRVSTAVDASMP